MSPRTARRVPNPRKAQQLKLTQTRAINIAGTPPCDGCILRHWCKVNETECEAFRVYVRTGSPPEKLYSLRTKQITRLDSTDVIGRPSWEDMLL